MELDSFHFLTCLPRILSPGTLVVVRRFPVSGQTAGKTVRNKYFNQLVSRVKPNGALALASVSYIGTTFAEIRLLQKFFDSSRGS